MSKKKTSSKAVAQKSSNELAPAELLDQMAQDSGKGIENADKDSFAIPFVLCLQSQSPQLETVDGAKPGLFINSVTNELYEEVHVVPVYFERQFLRWVDRDAGGGFKGAYSALEVEELISSGEAERSDDGLTIRIGETDKLSDTRQHYCLVKSQDGTWSPAVVACASTQIKKSKNWLTQINNFNLMIGGESVNPPSWARIYVIRSTKESNQKGSWYGITIQPYSDETNSQGLVVQGLYELGSKFYDQIVKGKVVVQHEDLVGEAETVDEDSDQF